MKNQPKNVQKRTKMRSFLGLRPLDFNTLLFTLLAMVCSTNSLIAQKFNGVELNQNAQVVINSFIAKGWVQSNKTKDYTTLKGKIANEEVLLTIYPTITSRKCRKIMALYTSPDSWDEAVSLYEQKCEIITNKYGSPVFINETFYDPYYLGDGYEIQALGNDKCEYLRIWEKIVGYPNVTIGVEIGNAGMVMVAYEINTNMELHKIELDKIQNAVY
jgi:hypothetical protein